MSQIFPEPTPDQIPTVSSLTASASSSSRTDSKQMALGWMRQSQELTAQWLYDLGGWVFGGLIVVALMLLQDLISLGSADRATLVASLAIVIALPLNLIGLGIVRYFNSLKQVVEGAKKRLAGNSGLKMEMVRELTIKSESLSPARSRIMNFTVSLALYLSVLFTIIALCAAFWRISWATTVLFLLASVLGVLLLLRALRTE